MNRSDIIRMAREAGFMEDVFTGGPHKGKVSIFDYGDVDIFSNLKRFASLVAAAKQEECARVAEDAREDEEYGHAAFRCEQIAADIRALK